MRLELTTPWDQVTCFTHWARLAPLPLFHIKFILREKWSHLLSDTFPSLSAAFCILSQDLDPQCVLLEKFAHWEVITEKQIRTWGQQVFPCHQKLFTLQRLLSFVGGEVVAELEKHSLQKVSGLSSETGLREWVGCWGHACPPTIVAIVTLSWSGSLYWKKKSLRCVARMIWLLWLDALRSRENFPKLVWFFFQDFKKFVLLSHFMSRIHWFYIFCLFSQIFKGKYMSTTSCFLYSFLCPIINKSAYRST